MEEKLASESRTIKTEIVLPSDTNPLGNLFGGRLMEWVDIAGSICAQRHCGRVVVTAAINHISFNHPIKENSIVTLEAQISRAFETSMEVIVDVFVENIVTHARIKCNEAILTCVAIDDNGSPLPIPKIKPQTELEQKRYDAALRRRQLSLILSGRLKPDDATELKSLFVKE